MVQYDIYDLYDLGEFEQKGTTATKWGTRSDLLELAKVAKEKSVLLYCRSFRNILFCGLTK